MRPALAVKAMVGAAIAAAARARTLAAAYVLGGSAKPYSNPRPVSWRRGQESGAGSRQLSESGLPLEESRAPTPGPEKDPEQFVRLPFSKVPEVTLAFWAVKILATTVGETGGDALSMSLKLGYEISSAIFLVFFVVALAAQIRTFRYHPVFYWTVVVATTTVGTTTSDMFDRTFGLGYVKSSAIEFSIVVLVLIAWRLTTGRLQFNRITDRRDEIFYWLTILVSNTLGTALGDFVATTLGLGFERGSLVFWALLGVVAIAYFFLPISRATLFWAAYVLTRPLGATLGDTLTKPTSMGGLHFDRITSSLVIVAGMAVLVATTALRKPVQADPENSVH